MSQENFLSFSFSCFVFSEICFFQVSLLSRVMPRYLTESLLGIIVLLMPPKPGGRFVFEA